MAATIFHIGITISRIDRVRQDSQTTWGVFLTPLLVSFLLLTKIRALPSPVAAIRAVLPPPPPVKLACLWIVFYQKSRDGVSNKTGIFQGLYWNIYPKKAAINFTRIQKLATDTNILTGDSTPFSVATMVVVP